MADGSKNLSYNVQVALDADNQIIVANDVSSEPTDQHQFELVIENVGDKAKVETDEERNRIFKYSYSKYIELLNRIQSTYPEKQVAAELIYSSIK